ncbi:MAG: nuclear transport factor 2 family protein [Gammaproteobacteria bacterium]|nr:nuclear transport factor 2 family protein [Gammaproteobacteria bacterium]
MATDDPVSVLDKLSDAWNGRDVDTVLALFSDDCEYEDVALGQTWRGKSELRKFVRDDVFGNIPDFTYVVKNRFATREWAAIEYELSGTPRRDPAGNPLPGKRFTVRGSSILELRDSRIRRNSDYWDMATAMRQLGLGA